MKKSWPDDVGQRFDAEQDPFMLIIDKDFNEFNPELDRWGIVWFSNFSDKPDSIYKFFGCIARKVRRDEELFDYLSSVAHQEKYKKFGKYFELKKPELFGISIDVQAILEDLIGP
ncbi:MAG: hypothetical protein HQ513_03955 [Rhodospirillales bacterium]|nr:hypothetical protein [Rhodospirillales bacterium]